MTNKKYFLKATQNIMNFRELYQNTYIGDRKETSKFCYEVLQDPECSFYTYVFIIHYYRDDISKFNKNRLIENPSENLYKNIIAGCSFDGEETPVKKNSLVSYYSDKLLRKIDKLREQKKKRKS